MFRMRMLLRITNNNYSWDAVMDQENQRILDSCLALIDENLTSVPSIKKLSQLLINIDVTYYLTLIFKQ